MTDIGIIGAGSISAAGADRASAWQTYLSQQPTHRLDRTTGLPVYAIPAKAIAPAVTAFGGRRGMDRASLLAVHAAREAVTEAGWEGRDFSILVGCSRGPTASWETGYQQFDREQMVAPRTSPSTTLGSVGFALADYFRITQLSSSLSVTCSSGLHALLHGIALLRAGMADRVLVGGTEAPLTGFTIAQMRALRVYASAGRPGQLACRPLADPPSGMVLGEGAAFLALERISPGSSRTAVHVGFSREGGASSTGISSEGLALQHSMRAAIGGFLPPDAVIAHAPGTPQGDAAERNGIDAVFGSAPDSPLLTSLKWATGHTFGASGPLAVVAGLDMLNHGQLLALPYGGPSPPDAPSNILINATGFGGNAVSVLLRRGGIDGDNRKDQSAV
ncbi:3-oxoacyl-[acyl-carrier-protein] synthase 2 [Neolewinella maritima]|uniref:3-oxoacyl-[acyl-carrier-protein] synthase 2 n=1 Tax=Neolewinella maritima TaxID=1383882 RepID=A0ABM9B013_9BACT|nr:beta-ketoacyl synthase N-terminal-like domain-containing protein [Neolewinella maritima]CAH1000383.1 3-oxoacyl-[acyl-carrier-protein] synthase 2 [Neolewinella maritima]